MAACQNSAGSLALFRRSPWGEGPTIMSQISKAVFGTIAASLTLGAVQLAFGHDLGFRPELIRQGLLGQPSLAGTPATLINRSAKADRAAIAAGPAAQTRTISLRLDSLSDTSVLIRVPAASKPETAARNGPAAPPLFHSGVRKATIACEPMVSVLTEVAKRLQPGRCVT
jgi:hypothetical protein